MKGLTDAMDIRTKAVSATIEDTSANAEEYPGTFAVELTNESIDRDGDTLKGEEWETPLPEQITFVNDHTHKMASVVGSAKPELIGGKIICRGTWAETENAQETRKVIKHVPYVSVAYREKRDRKAGTVSRELINGSFVVVPSNPRAKVLSSKGFEDEDQEIEFVKSVVDGVLSGLNASSTGSILPAGFTATTTLDSESPESTLEIKDANGTVILSHKFSAPEAPASAADSSADREKGHDLATLRARALTLSTRHEID